MDDEKRQRLLSADYTKVEIIELCWIHSTCLNEEEYEICAKIKSDFDKRNLDDYDKLVLKRHLMHKDTSYKYINELNGLLENVEP